MNAFPHLTQTDAIRAEAEGQYGGLSDAAALQQAHKTSLDPNVSRAANTRVNERATEELDPDDVQDKVDAEYGDGLEVQSYAVRGDSLSVVALDEHGRLRKLVVGHSDRFKRLPMPEDARAARSEQGATLLGAEAQAEIDRRVAEAAAEIRAEVQKELQSALSDMRKSASADEPDAEGAEEADVKESSRQMGRSETTSGASVQTGADDDGEAKYPSTHDDLDALAKKNDVEWPEGVTKVTDKQEYLAKVGVDPPTE